MVNLPNRFNMGKHGAPQHGGNIVTLACTGKISSVVWLLASDISQHLAQDQQTKKRRLAY